MRRLRRLIHEVHRRSLWQVVGIYLVGAWIAYQVILALTDGLGLPAWVPPFAFVLFLIGLPIVIATAFVQEGAPAIDDFRRAPRAGAAPLDALEPNALAVDAPAERRALTPAPDPLVSRFLTWPRALLGGVIAFALLGAGTTGWVGMRALGVGPVGSLVAAGALDAAEPILVADFQSPGRDSVIATVVSETFRIDFARSTLIRTVEPMAVRNALQRMGRGDATVLTPELAHEMAVRDGIKAYLVGDVNLVGGGYVISARLIATSSGETLVALRETARDSTDLIPAIDRLSRGLRERTGESLRTIRREPPLEQVTTSSLEALRLFTEGRRAQTWQVDQTRALELYEEAVALDSTFASAWRAMAAIHGNFDRTHLSLDAISRALRHQDRLTAAERDITTAQEAFIRRDYRRAVEAYERAVVRNPHHSTTLNNLAWTYYVMFDFPRAEEYYLRAIEAEPNAMTQRGTLASMYVLQGRIDDAWAAFEEVRALHPDEPAPRVALAVLPSVAGEHDRAEQNLRALVDEGHSSSRLVAMAEDHLFWLTYTRGRLAEAERRWQAILGSATDWDALEDARLQQQFWTELELLGDPARAAATLARWEPVVLRRAEDNSERIEALTQAAFAAGDTIRGNRFLERIGAAGPLVAWSPRWHFELHGYRELARGDHDAALRLFRASGDTCRNCFETHVARAFLDAGQPDSAAAAYERLLASPSIARIWRVDWQLAVIHERLADYYEDRGDANAAASHYARMVELWEHADAELQPRVERARRALERLRREG
jgi:eukaryotic-like serine/threonine-protein kinase